MILVPRGEGVASQALGGDQPQSTLKSKGKSKSLSESLVGFAELLRSLSAVNLSKSVEGKGRGGEEPLMRGPNMFSLARGGLTSPLTSGIPSELAKHKLRSIEGNLKQTSAKAQSNHLVQGLIERRIRKSDSFFQIDGQEKEHPSSEKVLTERLKKEGAVKSEGKVRKPINGGMEKQSRTGEDLKDPRTWVFNTGQKGKNSVSHRGGFSTKNLESETTKGKEGVQGKARTKSIVNEKIVQTFTSESLFPREGEKVKIESNLPTFELRLDVSADYRKVLEQGGPSTGSNGLARETILQQLQEKANPQIVQQAQVFLKDREDGEIRLVLKPEQLGEVRIRLHLQDRLIEGHITVENSTVKELFEQNKGELAQAFREQGFEMSQLEVSVGRDSQYRETEQEPVQFRQVHATKIAEQVPSADRGWMDIHRLVDYYA